MYQSLSFSISINLGISLYINVKKIFKDKYGQSIRITLKEKETAQQIYENVLNVFNGQAYECMIIR